MNLEGYEVLFNKEAEIFTPRYLPEVHLPVKGFF